jgi:hypothetical protein
MSTFTVGESGGGKFGTATVGQHVAKFLGVSDLPEANPPRMGNDGKPMGPAMAWEFEIVQGPDAGKVAGRITGKSPTAKNMAGRFLAAVTGQYLKPGVSIDLTPFVGRLYTITVEPNGQKTRLAEVPAPTPYHGGQPASSPAPSAGGPPPRRNAPSPAKPATGPAFYFLDTNPDADPVKVPTAELRTHLATHKLDGRSVLACPDGGSEWKALADHDVSFAF